MFNFLFLNFVFKILFTKAYVLDFGTEVYSWIGRHTKGAPRKMAAEIGLEHYNKGKKKMGLFSLLVGSAKTVSYTHLTLPTNREV